MGLRSTGSPIFLWQVGWARRCSVYSARLPPPLPPLLSACSDLPFPHSSCGAAWRFFSSSFCRLKRIGLEYHSTAVVVPGAAATGLPSDSLIFSSVVLSPHPLLTAFGRQTGSLRYARVLLFLFIVSRGRNSVPWPSPAPLTYPFHPLGLVPPRVECCFPFYLPVSLCSAPTVTPLVDFIRSTRSPFRLAFIRVLIPL